MRPASLADLWFLRLLRHEGGKERPETSMHHVADALAEFGVADILLSGDHLWETLKRFERSLERHENDPRRSSTGPVLRNAERLGAVFGFEPVEVETLALLAFVELEGAFRRLVEDAFFTGMDATFAALAAALCVPSTTVQRALVPGGTLRTSRLVDVTSPYGEESYCVELVPGLASVLARPGKTDHLLGRVLRLHASV